MKSQEPQRDEEKGRILLFRPRIPRARNDNVRRPHPLRSPVDDLSKYEQSRETESYRHRMVNNLLAFAVLSLIVYCGIWLANTMAQLRSDQDCVLTGRPNGRLRPHPAAPMRATTSSPANDDAKKRSPGHLSRRSAL